MTTPHFDVSKYHFVKCNNTYLDESVLPTTVHDDYCKLAMGLVALLQSGRE
jgi:hypothetical protein